MATLKNFSDAVTAHVAAWGNCGASPHQQATIDRLQELAAEVVAAAADPRNGPISALAVQQHHRDGECEVDDDPIVSEGEDNGAYVQAWVWVDFAGTDLDKTGGDDDDEEADAAACEHVGPPGGVCMRCGGGMAAG